MVEKLTWDNQNNLASVTGPGGTTRFVYDTSGQRLLRQDGNTTTVYLFGHELTVSASGDVVDAVRPYHFSGELVATRSVSRGVEYYLSGAAGSLEVSAASGASTVGGTRAYEPYGQVRAEDGEEFATDRGFLGQIEDAGTGLSYLNARYYDPEAALFLSPDPAGSGTNPYGYAAGNPASFADPSGLSPAYISGLEVANGSLRLQNKQLRGHIRQLRGHIRQLSSHISSLQGVIRKQHRAITKLLTHIDTLNGIIRQQQSIIRELENRVNYLIGVVHRQQAIINQLRATVAYQQRIINAQAARIRALEGQVAYYKSIVNRLSGRLWGHNPVYLNTVLSSIHSGNGIPAGAFAHDRISKLRSQNASLRSANASLQLENAALAIASAGFFGLGVVTASAGAAGQIAQLQGTIDAYAESIRGHRIAISQADAWIRAEYEYHDEEIDFVFGGHYLSDDPLDKSPQFLVPSPPPWNRSGTGFWEELWRTIGRSACVGNNRYQDEPAIADITC